MSPVLRVFTTGFCRFREYAETALGCTIQVFPPSVVERMNGLLGFGGAKLAAEDATKI